MVEQSTDLGVALVHGLEELVVVDLQLVEVDGFERVAACGAPAWGT